MQPLTLQVKGLRLAAQTAGNPDGPRVIALHGWLDNSESFARLAGELAECHWACLDFPGHGHSDHRPPGGLYHISDYVSDTLAALDALGWSRATLVGHSMGAGVACLIAAALPEVVERLVLIEGLGPMSADPTKAVRSLRTATRGLLAPPPQDKARFADVEEAVRARRLATPDVDPAALAAIVSRNLRRAGAGWAWRTDPRLRLPSPQPYMEDAVLAILAEIRAPTLLIEGTDGYLRNRDWFERRRACVADARHVVVPGDHHLHTGTAASSIAAEMRKFFGRPAAGEDNR